MKKILALTFLLTGCTNIDVKAINDRSLRAEAMAVEALAVSNEAYATSALSLKVSNDAVEAVSRMAEKCCSK